MLRYILVTVVNLAAFQQITAAEVSRLSVTVAPFVNEDTFAAAGVDVGAVNVVEIAGTLLKWMPAGAVDPVEWTGGAALADGMVRQLQQAGVGNAYLVIGLADIHRGGGPLAIVTARAGQSIETVEQRFRELKQQLGGDDVDIQRKGDVVLIGTKSSVARYAALKSSNRTDLVSPLMQHVQEHAMASVVFCPGPDFRRVVRELWPELPGPLAPLTGDLIDRLQRVEAVVEPLPNVNPRVALVANDAATAEQFAKLRHDLPKIVAELGAQSSEVERAKSFAQLLTDSLPAKVEGPRVIINVSADEAQLEKLRAMLGEAAGKSMEVSWRNERMNQFRQINIALQNFHDTSKHLPPAAICSKDGKPLLSWRVAILPFIDERNLYKEFHLDEPWDSPHNAALIRKMPAIYADPDFHLRQLAREGKTTYQVPVGPETVFHDNIGTPFRDITDGTSRTILVVEVAPSQAVEWTKPADWEVDLAHPKKGVERTDRDYFTTGFADAHTEIITVPKIDDAKLRALLTRAGGEVAQ